MIPTAFQYERATSVRAAVSMLRRADGGGRLLAGGHSLIPLMKLRLSEPDVLIDISHIPGLGSIDATARRVTVGATTTHATIAADGTLRERAPVLSDAAGEIGDPQVRNSGTLGGSLAHADPAADLPAVIVALDAEIQIAGGNGRRSVAAGDFFTDLFTVDLAGDELITAVRFAPVKTSAYAKLHQRASHYAIVGVAAVLKLRGRTCQSASIAITGAASHAQRLPAVEAALTGRRLDDDVIADAAGHATEGIGDLNADIHASAEYRAQMARVFTRRAIEAAIARR